ncbi:type IX secretion system sortase PorU [Hyunsoonleella pacifica]|uniref:Type IX secretion system sortase PorU n=1 Tax=Hyunsoonleella pacifica TaxID=1080224 RepID=A0A4V2JAM6_9FLAO|nr:type IX secretion system sortase PorU [Hyunsoonleella pacifica]TBN12481.1 type IX secretion system sortase PorU [Hyunsoonleella pacifica]GGD29145.1 peptidase C25 [Hyunsoonleella pacifica]
MKKKILILLLLVFSLAFGQKKSFSIDWNGTTTLTFGKNSIQLPVFNEKNYSYDFDEGLQFIAQWEVPNDINEASIVVNNINYQRITKAELLDIDVSKISTVLKYTLRNSKSRDNQFAYLEISPIVKDETGAYKKVMSFQVSYKTQSNNLSSRSKSFKNSKVITNSVLNSGNWYKFYIDTTGVFKLSKNFLQSLGVNVNTIDPRTIKIYGNGGRMIPYSNSEPQPFDVTENAIKIVGEQDGVFDNEDYILFYGEGPKEFNAESNTNINVYTDRTYYYITAGGGNGKRIVPFNQPSGSVDLSINTYQQYQFHERDIHNVGTVGRRWFGERFNIENEQEFTFNFPDLVTANPISLRVYAAAVSSSNTSMEVSVNGTVIQNLTFGSSSEIIIGSQNTFIGDLNVTSEEINVKLNYNNQGNPSALGYLDYISVEATRLLKFENNQFRFKNNSVTNNSGIAEYTISEASRLSEVWDVTDIFNVSNVENTEGESSFSFTSAMGEERVFMALSASNYFEPKLDANKTIRNQNIKGTIFNGLDGGVQDIDYLIVAPNNMLNQAERLAQINRNQYSLNVKVISLDEIYTEFSTSNPDIAAIRNLVKYIYDNASTPERRIKYLCLFGDGSYDYKDRIPNNTNIVPSWHSYSSLNLTNSFVSDDFYGMMDDNEGAMNNSDRLDIAVGRVLADTPQRARELVDKIDSYYAKESLGRWRNNYVVVSDDVDENWEGVIQQTTDNIGDEVTDEKPFVNVIKIHADAFQQESSAGGERYPEVNEEISNAIDNGALVVNYFGHGGEEGLSQERIFDVPSIDNLKNFCKLNCFVTVTCEFTKFDNPFRQTAGEFTYWNKQAGAISLITTTRQVFVNFGITFNNTLGQYLFSFSDNDGFDDDEYPTMAEALRLAKNDPNIGFASQRRLVFYIGDPAMKLAFPKPNIRLTEINDTPIAQSTDTLKALSRVKLAGEVTDVNGNLLSDYNGVVSTTIYDKFIDRQTLANDNTTNAGTLIQLDFKTLGAIVFRGQASVTNGQFEFEFVVPKDIGVPVGLGRVSFYARNNVLSENQTGADISNIRIGGVNENAEEDNTGPVINIFMNDENFVSGGITNESPTLLAKLEDANGINTASGIGHDIVAIIDGDETNPFVLNDYYETEVDNYQRGIVSFPFRDLEPGLHTLTLKAWDVYNNSSTSEIQFIVFDEDQELVINNVLNYPNPFVNYTEFWFNHNSSQPLDVSIQIFTVSGKLVRTLNGQTSGGIKATSSLSKDIVWDGRDDFGEKIGKGVYIYKLTVKSNLLNKKVEKIEKLVIL